MSATRGKGWFLGKGPQLNESVTGAQGKQFPGASFPKEPSRDALNVVIIFQDSLMRDWATTLWSRVSAAIAQQAFLVNSWRIGNLIDPLVLPEAVNATAYSDVLLVAVREWFEPPSEVTAWVEGWVPRRLGRVGSLAALIAVPAQELGIPSSAQKFLSSVAARAGLDFMPRQRPLPQERIDLLDRRVISNRANTTTDVLSDILNQEQQNARLRGPLQ